MPKPALDRKKTRQIVALERRFADAKTYDQWAELSEEMDQLTGGQKWRLRDESSLYDYESIRIRLDKLRALRATGDDKALLFALNEGIHGNMAGMGKSQLYSPARAGTKALIENYVQEISDALEHLAEIDAQKNKRAWLDRMEFFERASHCYGRSALMLSGGGTLGYFHFGVLKALIEQGLCPKVISGASAGAFVAAIVGTRTDAEYLKLCNTGKLAKDLTSNSEDFEFGLGKSGSVDMEKVKKAFARTLPDMTFIEAFEKTGRSINITISPSQPKQTSRLLNHISSPNVTLRSAVLASSALPGVFPPVVLEARDESGDLKPYLPSRRWIDGSFSQDLPARRLARMYGVNHFIVSQVMPGLGREPELRPGIRKIASDASVAATKEIVRGSLGLIQRYFTVGPKTGVAMNTLNALIDQRYHGDINIYPSYGFSSLSSLLKMLTEEEMAQLIADGESATWPKLPAINITTRIGRTLDNILLRFEEEQGHLLQGK